MKTTMNLFCLPFAGGSKYAYRKYSEHAPASLHLTTLEYPGRGARMHEELITGMSALVDDLYRQVCHKTNHMDYALYGHSMGGLVAYLLARKLMANRHRPPVHLFISGTTAPSDLARRAKKRHLMGKDEFLQELKDFGGMPDEVLQNEELLGFFQPILRADFKVCENYVYTHHHPLQVPFTVITGTEEGYEEESIRLWQNETSHPADFIRMPGKHFFILKHSAAIINLIYDRTFRPAYATA